MNVLSIDFDYFQSVSKNCIEECYPDGIDLNTSLSTIVWSRYYNNPFTKDKLNKVVINENELNEAINLLYKQNEKCPVRIANSHIHIYDFICEYAQKRKADRLYITHIDMHHDMFNDNDELDCGNWLLKISEKYKTGIEWIANPISREMFGLNESQFDIIRTSIADVKPRKYDIIFLCRSDNWLPPHLDIHFQRLIKEIAIHFPKAKIETSVKTPRQIIDMPDVTALYEKMASQNTTNR